MSLSILCITIYSVLLFDSSRHCGHSQDIANAACYTINPTAYYEFPTVNSSWIEQFSPKVKWSARNGHASCVFNKQVWVLGGRSDFTIKYNLQKSVRNADVWVSLDGAFWQQVTNLQGDFYAQNSDVMQPGSYAPWFGRYGHAVTVLPVNTSLPNVTEIMILTGGFAPDAMNDVWISENGYEWNFVHYAPWSPRAFHAATIYNNTLWILGGTPLNNEVWMISSITRTTRHTAPLTRAMYLNHTYVLTWQQIGQSPWSPRTGLGAVTQWIPLSNVSSTSIDDRTERILVVGGFGGWLRDGKNAHLYDGLRCRADVWEYRFRNHSVGHEWKLLTSEAAFGPRAWFGLTVWTGLNPILDVSKSSAAKGLSPRVWLVGGGYLGAAGPSEGAAAVTKMEGRVDVFSTRDGIEWSRVSWNQGGIGMQRPLWSSNEWSCFADDDGKHRFYGLWGVSLLTYNLTTRSSLDGNLLLLGGSADAGTMSTGQFVNRIWMSKSKILCSLDGKECGGKVACVEGSCAGCAGDDYCRLKVAVAPSSGASCLRLVFFQSLTLMALVVVGTGISLS